MRGVAGKLNLTSVLAVLLSLLLAGVAIAEIVTTTAQQLSLSTSGGAPSGASGSPSVASNGGFLVFSSNASNLVSSDTNSSTDIFLRNLTSGQISRVSVASDGAQSSSAATQPAISPVAPNGFYAVMFSSIAGDLSAVTDQFTYSDIFIHVPNLHFTEVVSINSSGTLGNGDSSQPSLTVLQNPNRALVAFASFADNLVDDSIDFDSYQDIFLATVQVPDDANSKAPQDLTQIRRITISATGSNSDDQSETPKITGDGNYIVFASRATNLISGLDTSGKKLIYRHEIATGKTELVSKDSSGLPADQDCSSPSVSYGGRFVTYASAASNILSGGTVGVAAIYLHDLLKNTIVRINTSASGVVSDDDARSPTVSANGRFVTFSDIGKNLISGDSNDSEDVFIKDTDTGDVVRASFGVNGETNASSDSPTVSATSYNALTGSIFYRSFATNITSGSTASGAGDIFSTSATLSAPQLKKGTVIETPADISFKGKRRSIISAQKFTFPTAAAAVRVNGGVVHAEAASTTRTVVYEFRVSGTGKRRKDRITLTSKKNTVTTAKLKPGVYNTRYRVTATEGTKVVSRTQFSPRQTFEIK